MKDRSEPDVTIREATLGDDDAVTALIGAYLDWATPILHQRYGIDDPPADSAGVRKSLDGLRRPTAMILIAETDGRAVGTGAVRGLGTDVAEIKRMWVDPEARASHVGSAILDKLLDEARSAAATIVRLDTCEFMTDAQRLYRSRGFRERPPYEGTEIPEHLHKYWVFFERPL